MARKMSEEEVLLLEHAEEIARETPHNTSVYVWYGRAYIVFPDDDGIEVYVSRCGTLDDVLKSRDFWLRKQQQKAAAENAIMERVVALQARGIEAEALMGNAVAYFGGKPWEVKDDEELQKVLQFKTGMEEFIRSFEDDPCLVNICYPADERLWDWHGVVKCPVLEKILHAPQYVVDKERMTLTLFNTFRHGGGEAPSPDGKGLRADPITIGRAKLLEIPIRFKVF